MAKQDVSGIYCIENLVNDKKYIGQSKHINQRFTEHKNSLKKNKHCNNILQYAWNKRGEHNFKFYILELCDIESLDEREIYYIDLYNSSDLTIGYNIDSGGALLKGHKSKEFIKRSGKSKVKDRVIQIDNCGDIIKIWNSANEATKALNSKSSKIYDCANGKANMAMGYIWVWEKNIDNFIFDPDIFDDRTKPVPINQYTKDLVLVKQYKSFKEAEADGFWRGSIKACMEGLAIQHAGFIWQYAEPSKVKQRKSDDLRTGWHMNKPIRSYDQHGNLLKEFDSIKTASEFYNIDNSSISKCCRGKNKTSHNMVFRYASDSFDKYN